ncbi:hypothetical protein LCGC14_2679380 [marine sediment metagenome]|uniref:Uncharacterized protein n=1 Tax=marine sediment metagenome TaxID=412755 RepID=A0A0F8ZLS5_9ZZZZ
MSARRKTKAGKAAVAVTSTRPKYRCRGPRVEKDSINRKGCGATLDKLIDRVKADGENHGIECPKCGNLSSVRKAPVEEVEAAAAEG